MAKTSQEKAVSRGDQVTGFAETLARWDDARLARMVELRPDLARPAPRTLGALVSRAASWPSIQQCRRSLDRGAQQVLDAACLLPAPPTVPALAKLLGLAGVTPELGEVLSRLEDLAMVIRAGDELCLPAGLAENRYPAHLGPPASVALATQHASALSNMARRLGVRPGGTRATAMAAVVAAISDPERVRLVLSQGPGDTASLARTAATGGPLLSSNGGIYGASDRTPAGWLVSHGLLAPLGWDRLVMPREAAMALRGGTPFPGLALSPPPLRTVEVRPDEVDAAAAERALRLVAEVRAVLELWGQSPPAGLKDGGIGIREVRRAARVIELTEVETARVIELAVAGGLVTCARAGGTALVRDVFDQWDALAVPERWAWLASGWLGCEMHPSLAGATDGKGKMIPALLDRSPEPDASSRRGMVLGVVFMASAGAAVAGDSLAELAEWMGPDIWMGGPALPPKLRSWIMEEAAMLGIVAHGALSSFGRLAIAAWYSPAHGPAAALRPAAAPGPLSPAVAALAPWAPAVSSTFVVQADLTAVAAGELASAVRNELELLADVESKGAATVYRFSEASLRRGFDAGRSPGQIVAFLEDHSSRGVPQALAYLVGDLGRRFGTVRVGSAASYLRCDDPALVAEMLAAKRASRLGLHQLAPTVLASRADARTTLQTLRSAGYLPALEGDGGELVVIRAAPQRSAAPAPVPWGGRPVDPMALVSGLRRADVSETPPAAAPPPPAPVGEAPPPGFEDVIPEELISFFTRLLAEAEEAEEAGAERPVAIVKDASAVMSLLEMAYDGDWMVRLGYIARNGRSSQLSCAIVAVDEDEIVVECPPRWDQRSLLPDRIEWARAMTVAEEGVLS